jgi:hypothetical protein
MAFGRFMGRPMAGLRDSPEMSRLRGQAEAGVRNLRMMPWRQTRSLWPAVQERFSGPSFLQLLSERRRGHLQPWNHDPVGPVAAGSCEESTRHAVLNDERGKTGRASSQIQVFAIDSKSVRFVAGEGAYAISGGVTGPCTGEARIRVWLGDPVTGYKLRDPTLGTETLVSGSLIVDLPGGNNVFSLVLEEFQLPANIPLPPSGADPWVLTASAVGGKTRASPCCCRPPSTPVSPS